MRDDGLPGPRGAGPLASVWHENGARQRFAPLVWSICRRYRLADADAADAGQAVWMQLAGHIGQIRDPAALPGWLAATTRRECGRIARLPC
jgi:DNA-directed RNA polymerase specialized sigma24 family protein